MAGAATQVVGIAPLARVVEAGGEALDMKRHETLSKI